jgi:hypothetical protein
MVLIRENAISAISLKPGSLYNLDKFKDKKLSSSRFISPSALYLVLPSVVDLSTCFSKKSIK